MKDKQLFSAFEETIFETIGEFFTEGEIKYDKKEFISTVLENGLIEKIANDYSLRSQSGGYLVEHFANIFGNVKGNTDPLDKVELKEMSDIGYYLTAYLFYNNVNSKDIYERIDLNSVIAESKYLDVYDTLYNITTFFDNKLKGENLS